MYRRGRRHPVSSAGWSSSPVPPTLLPPAMGVFSLNLPKTGELRKALLILGADLVQLRQINWCDYQFFVPQLHPLDKRSRRRPVSSAGWSSSPVPPANPKRTARCACWAVFSFTTIWTMGVAGSIGYKYHPIWLKISKFWFESRSYLLPAIEIYRERIHFSEQVL